LLDPVNNLLGDLAQGELVFDLRKHGLYSMNTLLDIHLIRVIVLQQVMCEVVRQLQAEHVVFQGHEVHVYLGNLVFLEQVVLLEELIALNGSSWYEENVNILIGGHPPVVSLENDGVNSIEVRSHDEDHRLVIGLS